MAHTILATDQPKTPDDQILGKDWAGEFQLLCTVYASDEVFLQVRDSDDPDAEWLNARFNGTEIKFSAAGDVFDAKLARDYEYQLITANAGAKVVIAKHDVHG